MEQTNNETINIKQIENEFISKLAGTEIPLDKEETKSTPGDASPRVDPKPRTGFLDLFFVEQLCEFKNNTLASKLGANLSQDGKKLVSEVYATTPEEIRAYNDLAEYGCAKFMPTEWIDGMDGFFKHPASSVLKVEIQKYRMLVKKLKIFEVQAAV